MQADTDADADNYDMKSNDTLAIAESALAAELSLDPNENLIEENILITQDPAKQRIFQSVAFQKFN